MRSHIADDTISPALIASSSLYYTSVTGLLLLRRGSAVGLKLDSAKGSKICIVTQIALKLGLLHGGHWRELIILI